MKFIKTAVSFLLLTFVFPYVYGDDVIFNSQDQVSAWTTVSPNTAYIFGNNYYLNTEKTVGADVIFKSDGSTWRTLTSSGLPQHRFFNITASSVTIDKLILFGGNYPSSSTEGGGAIYSHAGDLTVNGDFTLERSVSQVYGGAVLVDNGSVDFTGSVKFIQNTAMSMSGGAVYSTASITFSNINGKIEITGNQSDYNGGGLNANGSAGSGNVIMAGGALISSNTAKTGIGGGIFATGSVSFTNEEEIIKISSNSAMLVGGGVYSGADVSFSGGADITGNRNSTITSSDTFHAGAGVYAAGNILFSSSNATVNLIENNARDSGSALFSSGTITFNGAVNINANKVESSSGGAVWASGDITFSSATGKVNISSNSSVSGPGGALYSDSGIIFNNYMSIIGNGTVSGDGGALHSKSLIISDGGELSNNTSGGQGGAIFIHDDTSVFTTLTRNLLFKNNTASGTKNDIHLGGDATLNLEISSATNITFGSGISYATTTSNNIINKNGDGTIYLNGISKFQTLNINRGTMTIGGGSSFEAVDVIFREDSDTLISASTNTHTVIDFRNSHVNDDLKISGIFSSTTGAKIYYDIDSNSNASDKISAGIAYIEGTLIKVGVSGIDASTKVYTIIVSSMNAGSGSLRIDNTNAQGNTMTRVHSSFTYYDSSIGSTDTAVSGTWTNANLVLQIDQLNVIEGLTDNQLQAALALDTEYGLSGDDLFYIIDSLDKLELKEKKRALIDLSGHIYSNAITLPALNISKDNVLSRLKKSYFIPDDSSIKRNIWAQAHTASNKYAGDKNSPGDFEASNTGVQAGFDTLKDETQIFGLSIGYVDTNSKQKSDSVDITGYNIGGYGAFFFENNFELKLLLMGGKQNYTSSRKISYLDRKTGADFEGYSINTAAELGYDYFYRENIYFRPFFGADYSYVTTREFTESGANSADLTVYAGAYNRVNTSLGFQVNNGIDMRLKWYGELKFNFLLAGKYGKFEGEYKNTSQPLNIVGIENEMFSTGIGAGVLYDISKKFSAYMNINGLYSGTQTGYYANIGINYKFVTNYVDFYQR